MRNNSALAAVKIGGYWGKWPVVDPWQIENMREQRGAWILDLCQHDISPKPLQPPDIH